MKKFPVILSVVLIGFLFMGATLTFSGKGQVISTATGTYAASQKDTVTYSIEGIETALRFYIKAADSVSITNVIVRRLVGTVVYPPVAGDTLLGAVASVTNDTLLTGVINTLPLCQSIQVRVTYAASGQGVSSPTATYYIVKKYR